MDIACIGSRDLTPEQIDMCEKLGGWIAQCGHRLHTGNAIGADQAFARGANQVDPHLVHLHLPWWKYERQAVVDENVVRTVDDLNDGDRIIFYCLAEKYHGAWKRLSQGAQKLMVRNGMIIMPENGLVDLVLALPSNKPHGGGTGQGMRLAAGHDVRVVDLRGYDQAQLFNLCEEIAQLEVA